MCKKQKQFDYFDFISCFWSFCWLKHVGGGGGRGKRPPHLRDRLWQNPALLLRYIFRSIFPSTISGSDFRHFYPTSSILRQKKLFAFHYWAKFNVCSKQASLEIKPKNWITTTVNISHLFFAPEMTKIAESPCVTNHISTKITWTWNGIDRTHST